MAITAASIEANGWVLRVTLTGPLSSASVGGFATAPDTGAQWTTNFTAYALAPNSATPALTLAATTSGFVQSSGTAVASSTVPRSLIATKALRKATISGAPVNTRLAKTPDEIDNGDGTITVRLALSQHVYQGDTGLTLTALAGWRTGASATTGVTVTNNSTVLAPAPIVRWADVPYKLQSAAFPLEVVVASHHPSGLAPVAGVKFTVTDGTTVKSYWATALANSAYAASTDGTGKPLRVYGVTVDPTIATALTKGLLRCDFEVYPWIGPVQKSDPAGTKSMTSLGTAATSTSAFVPFVVAWNPGGAWITPRYAYVNPATGATTAAAANVSTVAATAAATPLASINLAIESLRLDAVAHTSYGTVAAANGQAAITASLDGCRIRLAAGATLGAGTTAVTLGANTLASWLVIEGDPADANPRADCILRTPTTANGSSRATRVKFSNLSIEAGTNAVFTGSTTTWLDNFELRGTSGQTAATTPPFSTSNSVLFATNGKWWQYAVGPTVAGSSQNPVLLRNVSTERALNAPAVFNCARLPSAPSAATTGSNVTASGVTGATVTLPSTDPGASLERMVVGCDLRYLNGASAYLWSALANANVPTGAPYAAGSLALGQTWPVASRQAILNNVCEVFGATNPLFQSIGENNPVVATENIVEGNTHVGDRTNNPYDDLNMATVALNDTTDSIIRVNRFANNVSCRNFSKQDDFNDPAVMAQRIGVALGATRSKAYAVGAEIVIAGSPANVYHCTTAGTTAATGGPTGMGSAIADGSAVWQWIATEARQHGYRPQAIGAWSSHYGVMYEGNVDLMGANDSLGSQPDFGKYEFYGIGSEPLWQDGLSITAVPFALDASGTTQRLDIQPNVGTGGGNYKPLATGAGVYLLGRAKTANVDTDSEGVTRVVPFTAGAIEGAVAVAVLPAADRQASRAAPSLVGWATVLAAARAAMASRAAVSAIGWATVVGTAGTAMPTSAAATITTWAATLVALPAAMASHAAGSLVGWAIAVAAAAGRLASRAAATVAGWAVAPFPDSDRCATRAAATLVTWRGSLAPDFGRSPTLASGPIVTVAGSWVVLIDAGRIAIIDRTLPIVVPGMTTPAERTLIVGGDIRCTHLA